MSKFFVTVYDDNVYTSVMEHIMKQSLTFSKSSDHGGTRIEVEGSPNDFISLREMIDRENLNRSSQVASITEGFDVIE